MTADGKRRETSVVITGLGAVAPNGVGIRAYTQGLRNGKSGLIALPYEDARVKTSAVGAVLERDWNPIDALSAADLRRLPRLIPMALTAAREAMHMAKIGPFSAENTQEISEHQITQSRRVGLWLGTGGGGIDFTIAQCQATAAGKPPSLWTITNATHGNLAGELSIRLGLRGPSHCISTGCTSSSDALGTAMMYLQSGRVDAAVVGGADSHLIGDAIFSMQLLGALSTGKWNPPQTASRPFDKMRDGFVLGEGAWFCVLERAQNAENRGAKPLAKLLGYGCTCDAYHRVRPDPSAAEAVRAIEISLQQANLQREQIDYVQYHGTSTQLNDVTETLAILSAFGDHAKKLPGSSIKSMIGHPQGACGAAAIVATIASLRGMDDAPAFLPPTINLQHHDPQCDLDYVPLQSRRTDARIALVNCLGFGAKNSALVVEIM